MKKVFSLFLLGVLIYSFAPPLLADNTGTRAEQTGEQEEKKEFLGLKFGVALAITSYGKKRFVVQEATIINGKVRVLEELNTFPRIMLETHYFFNLKKKIIGIGPFVGIQSNKNHLLDTIAFGAMTGFRYSEKDNNSFNFGIGAFCDRNCKFLGAGIERDKPLPEGESLYFYTRNYWGFVALISFSFL